jgi:hypothetical protein
MSPLLVLAVPARAGRAVAALVAEWRAARRPADRIASRPRPVRARVRRAWSLPSAPLVPVLRDYPVRR